jgi:PAS domain S-box-containing protein
MRAFFARLFEDFDTKDREELERRRSFLYVILYFGIGATILSTVVIRLANPSTGAVVILNGALVLLQFGLLLLAYRGQTRLASILVILLFEAYGAIALYYFGGIRNPVSATLLVVIMAAVTLLGQMGIVLSILMTGGITFWLALVEARGALPIPNAPQTPLQNWVAFFSTVLAGAIVMYAWYEKIRSAMRRSQQELNERKQAEAALRESEERYRVISSVSSDYVFMTVVDSNGHAYEEWTSDAFESITGYTLAELQALGGWQPIVHPDDRASDQASYARVLSNQRTSIEIRIIRKDGSLRWVRIYATPIWDEAQQRVTKFYGAVQDITERKLAEEDLLKSEARLRAVLDHIPYDLWVCDEEGRYITQNVRDTSSTLNVIGKTPLEITEIPLKLRQRWHEEHQAALRGQKIRNEFVEYDQAGNKKTFIVSLAPIFNGDKVIGIVGMSIDISDVKQAEEQVRALNAQLEQKVAERTAELEATIRDLEAFSYNVSHSVRAPLRSIHGYAAILAEEFGPHLPATARDYIDKIQAGARTMDEIITDLLDYNRFGRTRPSKTWVDIKDVFNVTLIALLKEVPGRQIETHIADLPPVFADMRLLRVVISHLLGNAIKFTAVRAVAHIEIGYLEQAGTTVYYVKDDGIGFDMKYSEKLFKVFQRLIEPGSFEGTGIGLAIAAQIIQKHGGKIWVEAAPGQGATFYFTLTA